MRKSNGLIVGWGWQELLARKVDVRLPGKGNLKLPRREAGPPNHHDDDVDSDQWVVNKDLSLQELLGKGKKALAKLSGLNAIDCVWHHEMYCSTDTRTVHLRNIVRCGTASDQ